MDALRSSNPRGLFHIQLPELLDEDNPALVGAIRIDPAVKNLVTSSTGVKVTRQYYYGTCRHKKRIKKNKKNKKKKTRRVWTHSKRGVKPQSVRDAEARGSCLTHFSAELYCLFERATNPAANGLILPRFFLVVLILLLHHV